MRQRRTAMTGRDLVGDGRAADDGTPLQDQRLISSARQVEGGNQAVVAGADDHDLFHGQSSGDAIHSYFPPPASLSILIAAFLPGAPMIPPPGWVADPQTYKFRTGVRYWAQPGAGRRKNSCSSV